MVQYYSTIAAHENFQGNGALSAVEQARLVDLEKLAYQSANDGQSHQSVKTIWSIDRAHASLVFMLTICSILNSRDLIYTVISAALH